MTASAPLAALLVSIRLPLASALQKARIETRVSGKSAAQTDSPSVLPALTFPDVLGDLVVTSEPATTLKEDAGPREAKPATAGRALLGATTRGGARNSQLCQEGPLAAAVPAASAVTTTTVTLAVVATAPEAQYRPANGSYMLSGKAPADPTPGEEDAPSLLDPAAVPAVRSTVPEPLPDGPPPETVPGPRPQELFAGLSAQPRLPSKRPLDQVSPTPVAALLDGTPSAAVQAAVRDGPADPTEASHALFPATTAESSRHSTGTAIQPPPPTGALEPARYGARDLGEPVAQSGGGKAAELAFGARLVPTAGPVEAPAGDPPDLLPVPAATPVRPSAAEPLDGAVPAPERFRKSETPTPSSWETSSASAARLSPDTVYAPAERLASASNQPEHPAAAEPRPAAAPEPSAGPEPTKPPAAARNIQLDVTGGDQRVAVRLTERGGEVEVAVRTPDTHLASALREDLPALSSRLAESGFRAETWHPASPGASTGPSEGHRLTEPSPGGTPQDPNGRSRQNGGHARDDSEPRQPQTREQQPDRKNQGKDFAWLMSSLR